MSFINFLNYRKYFGKNTDAQAARIGHVNAVYDQLSKKQYYSYILKITLDPEDYNYATYNVFYSDLAEGGFNNFSVIKENNEDSGNYLTKITVHKNNDSILDFTNVTLLTSLTGNGVDYSSPETTSFQTPASYEITFINPIIGMFNMVVWLEFRVYPNLL